MARGGQVVFGEHTDSDLAKIASVGLIESIGGKLLFKLPPCCC